MTATAPATSPVAAAARGVAGTGGAAARPPGEPRLVGYLYVLPAFAVFACFVLYPLGRAAWISLWDWGKTVRIYDNYFVKDRLTVKRGTVVTWRWPGFEEAGDVHDVKLKRGPRGVRKFHSEAAATDYRFRRKLRKPGRYRIVCTLHDGMRMKIRVRRR